LEDICASNEVTILNNSIGATNFTWDFDGAGTIAAGPYTNSFNYIYDPVPDVQERTITLIASNDLGCQHVRQRKVSIYPPIVAEFEPDVDEGCSPLDVNFENRSSGPVLFYYWSFGDGTFSTDLNPNHTFTNTSDKDTLYTVTLYIVSTSFFCSEIFTWDITVHPDIEAGFSFTPSAGCHPHELEIHDISKGADSYSWDLGDGTLSTSNDPVLIHTYTNTGLVAEQFTIRQVVTNQAGCKDSLERTLTVYPHLEASFISSETEGCADLFVEFTNTSTLTAQQIFWDFGDGGTSSDPNPQHTFKNTTDATIIYDVSLKVVSADFCEDTYIIPITVHPYLEARFDFYPAEACNPHEVTFINTTYGASSFEWDFGDGTVIVVNDTLPVTHLYDHNDPAPVEYEVILTVSNGQGCNDAISRTITIFPKTEALFTPSATQGCDGLEVQFTNNSIGVHEYLWDFGDGGTTSEPNPSHIFENTSYNDIVTYDVWLYTESEYLCRDSINQIITVYPRIKADFTIETVEGCSPFTVNISNYSQGVSIYSWDFGGMRTSDSDSTELSHTFYNTSNDIVTYTIELIVENGNGCTDVISQEIRVFPEVVADFSHITDGCHPLNVIFTNLSENADYFFWELGDGKESSIANPGNTYYNLSHFNDTTFAVQLRAESIHGCIASASSQVTVDPKPNASFNIENSPGCSPYEIEITNLSAGVSEYYWNFGDGSPVSSADGGQITHTFNHPHGTGIGYYDIELIVLNSAGCSDTLVQQAIIYPNILAEFTTNFTEGCHPLTIDFTNNSTGADAQFAYFWDYGDGNTSNTATNLHSHTFRNFSNTRDTIFEVMLVAQNVNGCSDTTWLDITVFAKPRAFFNIPHEHACAPYEINVHNFSVGAVSYLWNISDGTQYTYNSSHFNHTLNQAAGMAPGIFTINLDIENNHGCTHSYSQQVTVFPEVIAEFTTDNEGCHPHTSIFENQSIGAELYQWNFGNGNTSQDPHPDQIFLNYNHTESQSYTVTLRSESHYGCFAQHTQEIVVRPVPKPAFEFSETAGCSPFTPEISNISVGATGFDWNFGNGVSDESGASFNHTWINQTENPLSFDTQLRLWNEYGCEASIGQIIRVFPEVTAEFGSQGNIWEGCSPLDLRFLNQSSLATTYTWDFNDGETSLSANPPHVFINNDIVDRVFDVELTATSLYRCTHTQVRQVTVFPSPKVNFTATPYKQPYPDATITLTNLTNPGSWNFHWEFGDGNFAHTTSFNPFSHTYIWDGSDMNTKTYTVALMASNGQCSGMFTQLVTITSPVPIARYTAEMSGCEPFPIQFNNQSQFAHSYWWDLGTGQSQQSPTQPIHFSILVLMM
jgi:PKD repeat protein